MDDGRVVCLTREAFLAASNVCVEAERAIIAADESMIVAKASLAAARNAYHIAKREQDMYRRTHCHWLNEDSNEYCLAIVNLPNMHYCNKHADRMSHTGIDL